jgi:hypothetical protein
MTKKADTKRPDKAPLRKITEIGESSYHGEGCVPDKDFLRKITEIGKLPYRGENRCVLECGHSVLVPKRSRLKRTRCWVCLKVAQDRWDAEHTCKHGVIEPRPCKDCEIERAMTNGNCPVLIEAMD